MTGGQIGTDDRFDLSKPWVKGGYQYASDGAICVRRKTEAADTDDGKRRPNPEPIFKKVAYTECWPCPEGISFITPDDHGREKRALTVQPQEIAGLLTGGHYALLVFMLGEVRYHPKAINNFLLFRAADGTEGAVMSMRRDHEL